MELNNFVSNDQLVSDIDLDGRCKAYIMLYSWNQTTLFLLISSFLMTWMANLKNTVNSNTFFFTSFGQCSCCLLLLSVSSTEEDKYTCRSKAIHVCSLLLDNSLVVSAGVMR